MKMKLFVLRTTEDGSWAEERNFPNGIFALDSITVACTEGVLWKVLMGELKVGSFREIELENGKSLRH
jgi:hypothetical protein